MDTSSSLWIWTEEREGNAGTVSVSGSFGKQMSRQDQMCTRGSSGGVVGGGESLSRRGSDLSGGKSRQEGQPGRLSDFSAVYSSLAKPVGNPGTKVPC